MVIIIVLRLSPILHDLLELETKAGGLQRMINSRLIIGQEKPCGLDRENKESPAQEMILYTEKQLREAYKTYIENLTNSDVPIGNKKILHVPIPTLEEFKYVRGLLQQIPHKQ